MSPIQIDKFIPHQAEMANDAENKIKRINFPILHSTHFFLRNG